MDLATGQYPCVEPPIGPAKRVFLLGAPRSGTTWLAKLFDSHPDVLYRNEPDSLVQEDSLPQICRLDAIDQYRDIARNYIDRLLRTHTLKSSGSLPVFSKDFLLPLAIRCAARGSTHCISPRRCQLRRSWPIGYRSPICFDPVPTRPSWSIGQVGGLARLSSMRCRISG